MVVQWTHTSFSPRLSLFRDNPLLWHAFIGTITYCFSAALLIGGRQDVSAVVPIAGFLAVIGSFTVAAKLQRDAFTSTKLSTVLDTLGREGIKVTDDVYPVMDSAIDRPVPPTPQTVTQTVHVSSPGVLQEIDRPALVDIATTAGGFVRLHVMVGDSLDQDQRVMSVTAPAHIEEAKLRRCLTIGVERTFSQDPKYVLRILADIGARALSPAVNDPTTATDVLNVVELLLRHLATRDLGTGCTAMRGERPGSSSPRPTGKSTCPSAWTRSAYMEPARSRCHDDSSVCSRPWPTTRPRNGARS